MPISRRSIGGPTNSRGCKCALVFALSAWPACPQTYTAWRDYAGSPEAAQYSALKQINKSNVTRLTVAWTYRTGDHNHYLFNPIIIDGTMYVLANNNSIVALDAATGSEVWTHTPRPQTKSSPIAASIIGRAATARTGVFCSAPIIRFAPSMPVPASPSCPSARTVRWI